MTKLTDPRNEISLKNLKSGDTYIIVRVFSCHWERIDQIFTVTMEILTSLLESSPVTEKGYIRYFPLPIIDPGAQSPDVGSCSLPQLCPEKKWGQC